MSDVAAPAKSPKKKASKPKKPSSHPKYSEMIKQAIGALKERGGSSRQAILKYIMKNFDVGKDEKTVNNHLKMALRAGVKNSSLKQSKGAGASGSFKVSDSAAKPKKPKAAAKKPKAAAAKKSKSPKKAKAAKPKKAKSPKKAKADKPKKAKSPKKAKAAKPKKAKPAKAKKAVAKKAKK